MLILKFKTFPHFKLQILRYFEVETSVVVKSNTSLQVQNPAFQVST